jgi:ATP-binding cassette subfamily F protein 3
MLQVSNVSKAYGDNVVLDGVSFVLNAGGRIGLVGPNGCGKTTLLRIIVRHERPDEGSVHVSPSGTTVGYLPQAPEFETGATVGDVVSGRAGDHPAAEQEVATLAKAISTADAVSLPCLYDAYSRALARLEASGVRPGSQEQAAALASASLEGVDPSTPVSVLSGGQKTRLGLARLMRTRPDVLVLDEPSNHLDIAGLEWLEGLLAEYRGAILLVSHDRAILDHTVQTILELDARTHSVTAYPGSYSDYRHVKERELEQQSAAYQDQQERIARMEQDIRALSGHARRIEGETLHYHYRKIAKGLARRAVVQRRRLERVLESEERIEKPGRTWEMNLDFGQTARSGKDVLVLEDLALGYGGHPLFCGVNLTVRHGERIVLLGPNGSGKTTLLRGVMGGLAPLAGTIRPGANVRVGHYSQEQEGLEAGRNALEEIRRVAPMGETEARSFLHQFLFSGDDVFLPIERLSFGERARLALAKLVVGGCNLLLLDEPINHLDIPSRERFEIGLASFEGTVLAVVHDRYFIKRFATGLWSVEEGTIRQYIDLEDLQRARRRR